jgi:hypothetical protein
MELLSLRRYRSGYTGFWCEESGYVFFALGRSGRLRRLLRFDRGGFSDHRHFLYVMGRFFPISSFLSRPLPLPEPSLEELERLWRIVSGASPA